MQKILFVTRPIAPPWDEASKNFAYSLSKEISKNNPELEIHIMTNGKLGELSKKIIQENIYTSSEKDFRFSQKIRLLIFLFFNAHKFDVAHLLFTPTKLNSLILRLLLRKTKVIQTVATLREDLFSEKEIKKMMFGNIIATYSEYAKNKLSKMGFNNARKIYPGIDLSDYAPRPKNQTNNFVINFSGEYVRLGAMDDVIESFIEVSKKIPEARLSLGVRIKNEKDARKKDSVIKKLQEAKILNKVSFHDEGNYKMSDIYNMCNISVFPVQNMRGKFDIPLVVIEAMACEKPVIISDIPILKEFSSKNISISIEKGNIKALTNAILNLYENKEESSQMGVRARKYVQENFSIEESAKKYSETYESLLKKC